MNLRKTVATQSELEAALRDAAEGVVASPLEIVGALPTDPMDDAVTAPFNYDTGLTRGSFRKSGSVAA